MAKRRPKSVITTPVVPPTIDPGTPRAIAIVSGKGGSGKTMVAALIARILNDASVPVVLVDADIGTSGLTYYLGVKYANNTAVGLSEILMEGSPEALQKPTQKSSGLEPVATSRMVEASAHGYSIFLHPLKTFDRARLLGMGDQRDLMVTKTARQAFERKFGASIGEVISSLTGDGNWVVIDCRGGIDFESLAVCEAVNDIIIVLEPDTTAFQATQHLVKVLSQDRMSRKLKGFIINKVIDNPQQVSMSGTASFKCSYLSSLPFDIDATRSFYVGELPSVNSKFGNQLWEAMHKAYPTVVGPPPLPPWTFKDFAQIGLTDADSVRGGLVAASIVAATCVSALLSQASLSVQYILAIIGGIAIAGIAGCLEPSRRLLGRMANSYFRANQRIIAYLLGWRR